MTRSGWVYLLLTCLIGSLSQAETSLAGPWFRYPNHDLGFQIPVANGWRVIPVPHGVVFAMQYAPQPYVRVAVGRIAGKVGALESIIAARQLKNPSVHVRREGWHIDGLNAVEMEGVDADGPFRDEFIEKDHYIYWIGFTAERQDLWAQYSQTFNIIVEGFHFL